MQKKMKRAAAFFAAIVGVSAFANAQSVPSSGFFDWNENTNPTALNFTASPFLRNDNAAAVEAELAQSQALGKPLAVKIGEPLTDPAAKAVFDHYAVKYVFCDFEDIQAVGRTRAIADLVLNSSLSKGAFVGNFNIYPRSGSDGTRPGTVNSVGPSFLQRPFNAQYPDIHGKKPSGSSTITGKGMANASLYPGSPDYRSQSEANTPNIRSALFTLPIVRQTVTENGLRNDGWRAKGDINIPWVTRFNNWGNNTLDSDGDPSNGYQFVQNAANPANGQLLSRGDFSAQILHYRLRGADSVNLFQANAGSVVGYSESQEQDDIRTGWGSSSVINGIFSRGKAALANLTTTIGDTGGSSGDTSSKSVSTSGAVWSGVYDKSGANSTRRLAILLSNLSNSSKTIDLPNKIGGFHTYNGASLAADDDYLVAAGQHRLVTFTLTKNAQTHNQLAWLMSSNSVVFTDNDRNGVGIPEPTSIGLLGLGAIGLLARRRRQA